MSYHVFLSHAGCDRSIAEGLKAEIERFDVVVYMYEHDVQPGANLPQKLIGEIDRADALLVILTHAGGASRTVNGEIGVALGKGKLVIPLLENGVDPILYPLLQGIEWMPFDPARPDHMRRAVADFLERKRRSKVKGQIVVGAIAAGLLLWGNSGNHDDDDWDDD